MPSSITLLEFLRLIPKVELHYHLLGGVRLKTMLDLAKKYNVPLSELEAKSYYRRYIAETGTIKGGIAALNFLYPLLREAIDYERIAYEILEDAKNTGLRYVEFFWNPSDAALPYSVVTETLSAVFDKAEFMWNIKATLIPSINREKSPEEAVAMVKSVLEYPHPRVLGIGIDYREDHAPIEHFWKAYRLAQQGGLRLTGHCSEFGLHWRNVETGLDLIHLERIDHGYTVVDNPELMQRCAEQGVPFTVVPSNTFYLRKWPDPEEWAEKHPIRTMAKAGMKIIPATDDWHMHATDSIECYRVMIEEFGFDLDGIRQMILNSIDAAWQPEPVKQNWRHHWLKEFDALRNRLAVEPYIAKEKHVAYGPSKR